MTVVLLVAGATAVLIAWLPSTVRNAKLVALQNRCLDYDPAPNTIAFDTRRQSLPSLQRSDPDVRSIAIGFGSVVGRVPSFWPEYHRQSHATASTGTLATVYLHRANNPAGKERLVAVNVYDKPRKTGFGFQLWAQVFEPGGLRSPPREVWFAPALDLTRDADDVVILAGQGDPKRPDHFTIPATVGGTPYVIDGYLRDDDSVSLELVPRSATPPPPP